ncbi:MAG TPA: AAA family ATPase [Acidimicrobiia bacterium]|nr:AAA family ATPase [Acidimicrobiia bacterium]
MEPLRIHLFGGFLLERGATSLPPIASRTGRSLFAYLVANRQRPISRDLLAGTFWPDLPDSRARRRLSHALWQIQDVVNVGGVTHLKATSDTLTFNTEASYWLDVEEFDSSFKPDQDMGGDPDPNEPSRLRRCVELYRGDFLAGYFDDWVVAEQEHYRQKYLTALRRLVTSTKAGGDYEEALDLARRLTHHDSLSEDGHREVMRLNFLLGRTTEAIDQYERLRSVLAEELGTEPSAPTQHIYERVLRHRRSRVEPAASTAPTAILAGGAGETPFVGRDSERRILVDALEQVLGGNGGVVMVEGEPGIGKTRLAVEMGEDARWRGFEVTWAHARPGAVRPFGPIIDLLNSLSPLRIEQLTEQVDPIWLQSAARLAPVLGGGGETGTKSQQLRPDEESTRMLEALVHILASLGDISPHVVIIDDVQWSDRDTLAVLKQLAVRLAHSQVLLVLAYRSEEARGDAEVWDTLRQLDRSAGLGRAILSPLSVFELEEMIRRSLGTTRLDSGIATRIHRQTGGNILFTLETLLTLRDRGLFSAGSDPIEVLASQIDDGIIPVAPRVRVIIEARMSLLSPEVLGVYEVASIIGDHIDVSLISRVATLDKPELLRAIDELLFRGLLVEDSAGRFHIAHDQARQVVYESVPAQRRVAIHRAVAQSISELAPENIEAIGHHFREAGEAVQATDYLRAAGLRAIELSAYGTARQHLQAARETSIAADLPDGERYLILRHLEDALNVLGRRSEQADVIEEMAELAESIVDVRGDVERRRASLKAQEGDLSAAVESAVHSVAMERETGGGDMVATALIAEGAIRRWSGKPVDAIRPLEDAVASAKLPKTRARALTELASTLVEVQKVEPALQLLDTALEVFDRERDTRGRAEVAGIQGRAYRAGGQSDRAAAAYEMAIELCREIGYRHGEGVNLTNLANLTLVVGHVADALERYDRAALIFEQLGNRRGEAMVLVNSAHGRHNLLGSDVRAREDAQRALRMFEEFGDRARAAQCLEILAGVAARAGDRDHARELLEESLTELGVENVVLEVQHLRSLALLALEDDQPAEAIAVLDRAEARAGEGGLDHLAVELKSIRAIALIASGEIDAGLALASEAADDTPSGVERPYLIHHRLAIAAEAAGDRGTAKTAALEAHRLLLDALAGLGPSGVDQAIARVPEHRAIAARANTFSATRVDVVLPRDDAPTGRSLTEDDLVRVTWTVEQPDDAAITDPILLRRQRLLRVLDETSVQGAAATVDHIAEALGVSPTTVRRDLAALRADGHQVTTRGQRANAS